MAMADLAQLRDAVARHPLVARVVVAGFDGSAPRETGTAMLVWPGGSQGTVGGGALEFEAMARARAMIAAADFSPRLTREPLGPKLGQCCGGAVTLLTEVFTQSTLPSPQADLWLRPVTEAARAAAEMPFTLRRIVARNRSGAEARLRPGLYQGWMAEAVTLPRQALWIWGAGHVGRAMVQVLQPLPEYEITWIDTDRSRFPEEIPEGVTARFDAAPQSFCTDAPAGAAHLIVTFSHALDLELCHRLLLRGEFSFLGLIGSATKRARFRSRLAALGHGEDALARLTCPIGERSFGKHPQAIAIGVAHQLLKRHSEAEITDDIIDRPPAEPQRPDESLSGGGREQRRLLQHRTGGNPRASR
ncbi:xanthine dehydrogenase accessory protein XdhC [Falsigemmobacter intermedius]|uniref:Xanthine dehydrogenase accessory protein XdhC n=2 Tax=Falsigemmobacter intermedius TaxID=1553448 RepID=A0A3S4XVY8_9RHOB|nr:xanthine dehydrogenase accessory protein XdhC [Falsigemmobacter intermedius]RWY42991.1 xanthine dehydrogenase accessory protein XdhC [Falsigemmobacter intermedius]